jgi:3-oxoacyl-[acyl-carrier-protein] synthase II
VIRPAGLGGCVVTAWVVTSLGTGKADNWRKLTAGASGIHAITRFPTDALKTRIAGTVDFIPVDQIDAQSISQRLAEIAATEAVAESGISARGDFPGPLFLAVPPAEMEWPQRQVLAQAAGANHAVTPRDLLRVADAGRFTKTFERFEFASVADHLAEVFGTKGSPISLSTACASGATAIQLGVEAIRRGEAEAALCIGTDGSVNPESLIRFSLLSALSTANDPPQAAAKPFSKNRDGFVMAEGAGALVLESLDHATARGAKILGVVAGCGEMADAFHRTRSSPDGKPIIGCMRNAIADAGLTPDDIDYVNPHGTGTPENDKMEYLGVMAVFGRSRQGHSGLFEQIDGRAHAVGGRRGRGGVHAPDARPRAPASHHQLPDPRSGDPARCGPRAGARRPHSSRPLQLLRFRRPGRFAGHEPGAEVTAHARTHARAR